MSAQRNPLPDDHSIPISAVPARDASANERIVKNLTLTQRFVGAVFADPSILDDLTGEGDVNVVLLPSDDPEFAEANRRGGRRMQQAGKRVKFVPV